MVCKVYEENPHAIQLVSLHSVKVREWYAASAWQIIGFSAFHQTEFRLVCE
jgi:hypothetical protein